MIPLALTTIIADANDPRHVNIKELRIICNGRPGGDIVYPLTSKKDLEKMASGGFVLKVDRCKRPARPPARPPARWAVLARLSYDFETAPMLVCCCPRVRAHSVCAIR